MATSEATTVRELRHEIVAFLERHARAPVDRRAVEIIVSELLTNAWRHAQGPLWVNIEWSQAHPVLRVADLGPGFELNIQLPAPGSKGGRGLFIVDQLGDHLEVARREAGGSVVSVTLPVTRAVEVSIDPPRRRVGALPTLDQALPTGGFGKEAFLNALVVQLGHALDQHTGPDIAERVVAQVAADVGGRMEEEYRHATGALGRLSSQQLAECFVRLKHAIDGRFAVAEISERRIVLENSRCPFGSAVQIAPSLCRMTSSVFGGIAARNSEREAHVILEERIAVGDPRCRVVIDLDPDTAPPHAHRYRRPT